MTIHSRISTDFAAPAVPRATQPDSQMSTISLAGLAVPVVKGGLYDRYRSNPPLSAIAAEDPDIDLSWFRQIGKEKVDMGFESFSPNFYYRSRRITAVFTADLQRLQDLMPSKILEAVHPLRIWPGRGLVALTAYAYDCCDNDSYNEIGLSVITSRPGSTGRGPFALLSQSLSSDLWGYVLQLPVNTELARVRGVVGYNLPKWRTDIRYRETEKSVIAEIFDSETSRIDVMFEGRKLSRLSNRGSLVRNSFTNLDHQGQLTTGHAISRQFGHASSSHADSVKIHLTEGGLSAYIKALKLGRLVRYEYVPLFQSALYAPRPL